MGLFPPAMAPYMLQNLVPRRETRAHARPLLTAVATITWLQWAMFLSGHVNFPWITSRSFAHRFFRSLAWICDALDFFSVSLSVTSLEKQFNRKSGTIVTQFFFPFARYCSLFAYRLDRRLLSHSL